jgi:hypothetical protein
LSSSSSCDSWFADLKNVYDSVIVSTSSIYQAASGPRATFSTLSQRGGSEVAATHARVLGKVRVNIEEHGHVHSLARLTTRIDQGRSHRNGGLSATCAGERKCQVKRIKPRKQYGRTRRRCSSKQKHWIL